jgi:hypothetical protein
VVILDLSALPGRKSTVVALAPPRLCTAIEPNGLQANDQEMFTDSLNIPTR